jgi:hypothetical protein
MEVKDRGLREIWKQNKIPVVFRQSESLLIRIPYAKTNREWLKEKKRKEPIWDKTRQRWETPITWYENIVKRALERFGEIYVIQLRNEMQKCAPACWNAQGFHCECSCMGARHGSGHPGHNWHEVSETFAFNWNAKTYACRLIKMRNVQTAQPNNKLTD